MGDLAGQTAHIRVVLGVIVERVLPVRPASSHLFLMSLEANDMTRTFRYSEIIFAISLIVGVNAVLALLHRPFVVINAVEASRMYAAAKHGDFGVTCPMVANLNCPNVCVPATKCNGDGTPADGTEGCSAGSTKNNTVTYKVCTGAKGNCANTSSAGCGTDEDPACFSTGGTIWFPERHCKSASALGLAPKYDCTGC